MSDSLFGVWFTSISTYFMISPIPHYLSFNPRVKTRGYSNSILTGFMLFSVIFQQPVTRNLKPATIFPPGSSLYDTSDSDIRLLFHHW